MMLVAILVLMFWGLLFPALPAGAVLSQPEKDAIVVIRDGIATVAASSVADVLNRAALLSAGVSMAAAQGIFLGNSGGIGETVCCGRQLDGWLNLDDAIATLAPVSSMATLHASLSAIDRSLLFFDPRGTYYPQLVQGAGGNRIGSWDDVSRRLDGAVIYALRHLQGEPDELVYADSASVVPYALRWVNIVAETNGPPTACPALAPFASFESSVLWAIQGLVPAAAHLQTAGEKMLGQRPGGVQFAQLWNRLDQITAAAATHESLCGAGF